VSERAERNRARRSRAQPGETRPRGSSSAPPTLTRRTPASLSSASVVKSLVTSTFTGLGAIAATRVLMSAIVPQAGARDSPLLRLRTQSDAEVSSRPDGIC